MDRRVGAHLHQHVHGPPAHLLTVDAHRRQRRPDQGAEGDVVDAHHRHIVRNTVAEVFELAHRPDRHHVVVGEDAIDGRQSLEQLANARGPALERLVGPDDVVLDMVGEVGDRSVEAALARFLDRPAARAGHHAEDGSTARSEVLDGEERTPFGVRFDRPDPRVVDRVVHGDHGNCTIGDLAELVLAAADGKDDETVAPAIDERSDHVLLAPVLAFGAGQEDEISVPIARLLDAPRQLGEERVDQVGGNQPDREALRVTRPRASRFGR